MNASSRTRPAAEHNPDHAGEQYSSLASTVDLKTFSVTLLAFHDTQWYSSREQHVNRPPTWSAAVSLSLMTTPSAVKHPSKNADWRLRQISAYNVLILKDSEKSSIMMNRKLAGFPASYNR